MHRFALRAELAPTSVLQKTRRFLHIALTCPWQEEAGSGSGTDQRVAGRAIPALRTHSALCTGLEFEPALREERDGPRRGQTSLIFFPSFFSAMVAPSAAGPGEEGRSLARATSSRPVSG